MISQRYLALSLLGLSSAFSVAGESLEPVNSISQTTTPDFMEKIKFSGDIDPVMKPVMKTLLMLLTPLPFEVVWG
jgi:hypothetical protein